MSKEFKPVMVKDPKIEIRYALENGYIVSFDGVSNKPICIYSRDALTQFDRCYDLEPYIIDSVDCKLSEFHTLIEELEKRYKIVKKYMGNTGACNGNTYAAYIASEYDGEDFESVKTEQEPKFAANNNCNSTKTRKFVAMVVDMYDKLDNTDLSECVPDELSDYFYDAMNSLQDLYTQVGYHEFGEETWNNISIEDLKQYL